jgi:E3 ubiquitin-protein ligase RNF14
MHVILFRHGPITHCPISTSETFVLVLEEYMTLEDGSEEQIKLERRYGRKNLQTLASKYQEEKANGEYLKQNSTTCPGCGVSVQKSLGCNHVSIVSEFRVPARV